MRTDLYDTHVSLGAKMVSFGGWSMPIQYDSIIQEHHAVRNGVGIFDVSHMGRVDIEGPEAEAFLDYLSTNRITGKNDGSAVYTAWCREDGTTIDDLIVYKRDANHFFVIVNAGNRDKDLQHMVKEGGRFDIRISDRYGQDGILAVQGPAAVDLVAKTFPEVKQLKFFRHQRFTFEEDNVDIAATGYTGAGGVEICGSKNAIRKLWDRFTEAGAKPIGLGARDTLRLEMGLALYGHELDDTISPVESVSAWTVKGDKPNFLGKKALERYTRKQYGVVVSGKGIAREGYSVYRGDVCIGTVTSGTHSPTLGRAIALVMVDEPLKVGDKIEVEIRQKRVGAEVVPLPFLQKEESKK